MASDERGGEGSAGQPVRHVERRSTLAAEAHDGPTVQLATVGQVLSGRYQLVRELARGAMGVVYEARDAELDARSVAVKVLPPELAGDEAAVLRLKDEAAVAMKLTHENIVALHSFERDGAVAYLVMELLDGGTLALMLAQRKRLPLDEVLDLARQGAAALTAAHEQRVVHRDVKPANLMFATRGGRRVVKLVDFGVAYEIRDSMTRLTGVAAAGTVLYAAPEQLRGKQPDARADQYSFAVTLYEALCGRPPFSGAGLSHQILEATPEPLADVPPYVNAALLRALSKEPADRFADCRAFAAALEGGEATAAAAVEATVSWNEEAERLGPKAPAMVSFEQGAALRMPSACAWCGEPADQTFGLTRSADDETELLKLPICARCLPGAQGWWLKRKLLGCSSILGVLVAGGFGFDQLSVEGAEVLAYGLLGLAALLLFVYGYASEWLGGQSSEPATRRAPRLVSAGSRWDLFAASGFLLALAEANPARFQGVAAARSRPSPSSTPQAAPAGRSPGISLDGAVSLLRGGDVAAGRAMFERLCELDPGNFTAHALVAFDDLRAPADPAAAQRHVEALWALDPTSSEYGSVVTIGSASKSYEFAFKAFGVAKGCPPRSVHGDALLAVARLMVFDLLAQAAYRPVGSVIDTQLGTHVIKGAAQLLLRRHEEALETFAEGVRAAAEVPDAYEKAFGFTLEAKGRDEIQRSFSAQCLVGRALTFRDLGRRADARAIWSALLEGLEDGDVGHALWGRLRDEGA